MYRGLVREYPEFIDAHHHLALLLSETGRREQAFELWRETVALGLECLPAEFDMRLDSVVLRLEQNVVIMRLYTAVATIWERGKWNGC